MPSIQEWRRGRVARLGSAKAPTAVRIRTMPLKPSKQFGGFFMSNFLEKLIKQRFESDLNSISSKVIYSYFIANLLEKISIKLRQNSF